MKTLVEKYSKSINSTEYAPLNEDNKASVALMFENAQKETARALNEGTLAADVAQFTPILIPMLRRVNPALISNYLVGIQGLKTPTGYIYSLTNHYTGDDVDSTRRIEPTNDAQILVVASATGFTIGGAITSTGSASTGTVVYIEGNKLLVQNTNTRKFVTADDIDNANPFAATATSITATYSNEAQFIQVFKNYTGRHATSVAERLGTDMREVGFNVQQKSVEAQSRKLKGKYTIEMYQDLKAMHGLDADKIIRDLMAAEVQFETDIEVIDFFNATASAGTDVTINSYDGRWEIEKYRSIGIKIADEARKIGRFIKRGKANTVLTSPKGATMLEALGTFATAPIAGNIDSTKAGFAPDVGIFDKQYRTVVDNFTDQDSEYMTVSYKGSNYDAAVYLCPYTGAQFIRTVDQDSGQPAVILSTRYGLTTNPLSAERYGTKFDISFTSTALA